jgi:archaellum component FlaC
MVKFDYDGPMPQAKKKGGISEREIGRLEGRIEALERQVERLAEGFRHHMTKGPGEAHPQARA